MEITDYLRTLRTRWVWLAGGLILGLAAAGVLTATATPQYSSSSRIYIATNPSLIVEPASGGVTAQQRVTSFADIVTGQELAQRVVTELDLDLSAEQLTGKVSATVVPGTVVLSIAVVDSDPEVAQQINTVLVDQLRDLVADLETLPGESEPLVTTTVVDAPRLPGSPISPQPSRNLLYGGILGLLLGVGAAVLRELLDKTVRTPDEVADLIGAPLLASLPFDSSVSSTPLISRAHPQSAWTESFRILCTNLSFVDVDRPSKAIVVTSAVQEEGKSLTAINTAIALSDSGSKVLLVDADLRRPQVAARLGVEQSVGLTTVLIGSVTLEGAVQQRGGLDVLTSGQLPPNPAELLQSKAMHRVLAKAREHYEIVIVDAPPLLPVADAGILASQTDGAVLVLRQSRSTRDDVAQSVQRLRAVNSSPLGFVLNMVRAPRGKQAYGYASTNAHHAPTGIGSARDGLADRSSTS